MPAKPPQATPSQCKTWCGLALGAMLYGVLAGVNWPNSFALTHLGFDYSNGFIKRGLIGESLRLVLGPQVPFAQMSAFSFGIAALWLGLLVFGLFRLAREVAHIWLFAAVVFVSPGLVYLAHTVGYFDHVGLLIAIVCLFLPASVVGVGLRVLLCAGMIAVHEAFYLMFFGVVLIDLLLRCKDAQMVYFWVPSVVLIITTTLALMLVLQMTLPVAEMLSYEAHVKSRMPDVEPSSLAVAVVFHDVPSILNTSQNTLFTLRWFKLVAIGGLFLLATPIFYGAVASAQISQHIAGRLDRRLVLAALWGALFAPVCLCFFGVDVWRFLASTQVVGLLLLMSVLRWRPKMDTLAAWARPGPILAALAVLGAATEIRLLERDQMFRPPYLPDIMGLLSLL